MLSNEEKLLLLSGVIESNTFKGTARLKELLKYLVKCSINGIKPKESSIAMDVLGKDKSFDSKDDAIVRVYVNNLRTKLEQYYNSECLDYKFRIIIPKGHYEVLFESSTPAVPSKKNRSLSSIYIPIIIVLAVAISYLLYLRYFPTVENPLLKQIVSSNNKPTLIVLGDFFFLKEEKYKSSETYNVRDFSINSRDDFQKTAMSDSAFHKKFSECPYTYLRPSGNWGLMQILPELKNSRNEVKIKLASELSVEDFKSNNIIFIGQIKSLYILTKFLAIYGIRCNLKTNTLVLDAQKSDSQKVFNAASMFGGKYERDYGFVVKGTGPEGTNFILLTGFAEVGVLDAIRNITSPKLVNSILATLEKSADKTDENFTVVLESEGLNQTIFNSQIKYFYSPKPNFQFNEDSLKITP